MENLDWTVDWTGLVFIGGIFFEGGGEGGCIIFSSL